MQCRIYDGYAYGASVDYGTDCFSIGVMVKLDNSAGFELLSLTRVENFTAKLFGLILPMLTRAHMINLLLGQLSAWINLLLAAEVARSRFAATALILMSMVFLSWVIMPY